MSYSPFRVPLPHPDKIRVSKNDLLLIFFLIHSSREIRFLFSICLKIFLSLQVCGVAAGLPVSWRHGRVKISIWGSIGAAFLCWLGSKCLCLKMIGMCLIFQL